MKIKIPFGKKNSTSNHPKIDGSSVVKRPSDERDSFESALIMSMGLLIGALVSYLIITHPIT